jgi:hypothetical protein
VALVDVQSEHAQLCQLGPERGQVLGPGLEQAAGSSPRLVLRQEVRDGLREGAVIFRDGDRHE